MLWSSAQSRLRTTTNTMAAAKSDSPRFTGEHDRTLDAALRVILPKDWRSPKITELYLIPGSAEAYLRAMPCWEYDAAVAKIAESKTLTPKEQTHHFRELGKCTRVKIDSSWRLAVPSDLCERIGVSAKKPDVILHGGVMNFEIWNPMALVEWTRKRTVPDENGKLPMTVQEYLGL